jgi:NADH dehydrogenase
MQRKRIVIVGAGQAGLPLVTALSSYIYDKDIAQVVLIDKNNYLQNLAIIHLIATGFRTSSEGKSPIAITREYKNVEFIQAELIQIRPNDNEIVLDKLRVSYDVLVIAIGAFPKYESVTGAKENALPLKSIDDAVMIYKRIKSILNAKKYYRIVAIGGGPTGVSFVGALSDLVNKYKLNDNIEVTLVESSSRLLPGWSYKLSTITKEILKEKEVKIKLKSRAYKVEKDSIYLTNGVNFDSSLTVWTGGTGGNKLNSLPEIETISDGRILVNNFCQTPRYRNIFAIGDISAMKNEEGEFYPQLAQIALRQAKYLAKALIDYILNDAEPIETFKYKVKARMLLLGKSDYAAEFGKYVIRGHIGRVIEDIANIPTKNIQEKLDKELIIEELRLERVNERFAEIRHELRFEVMEEISKE